MRFPNLHFRVASALLLAGALTVSTASAQDGDPGGRVTDAGVMQGFPPSAERVVTKRNSFQPPYLRWALQNARLMMPTANIEHAREPMPLPAGKPLDLDSLRFRVGDDTVTLAQYLALTHTDGFIVVSHGKVVYERYFAGYGPRQPHAWASMTKSMTGLIAAQLIDEGKLDPDAKLSTYVPELANTPFGAATVQQNLDMEVPVSYPANLPPDLGLFGAVGFVPRHPGAPDDIYDFLKVTTPTPDRLAGDIWYYQNGSPEALAWALRRVTGKSWRELVSDYVWRNLAEDDGYVIVDRLGTEMASGGLNTTLRDAARFAELVRTGKTGAAPLSRAAIRTVLKPTDNAALFARGNLAAGRAGYAYHDYWYQVNDGDGSFEAIGRFGQAIFVDPKAALTIVKFSSAPDLAPRPVSADTAVKPAAHSPLETSQALVDAARAIVAAAR